jgi:hypothetical protein
MVNVVLITSIIASIIELSSHLSNKSGGADMPFKPELSFKKFGGNYIKNI